MSYSISILVEPTKANQKQQQKLQLPKLKTANAC